MWQYDFHEPQPLDGTFYPVGNKSNIFEKHYAPLCFTQKHFVPNIWGPKRLTNEPQRVPGQVSHDRGNEVLIYGARRWREHRSLRFEDLEMIAAANKREDEEFAEKLRRTGGDKVRWWHTRHTLSQRDSLKTVKMTNFTFNPERLVSCKEVVILNLTGCQLGDQNLVWVSTFMQQNQTLRRLILQGNRITAKGIEQLAPGIADAPAMIELDLGFNPIGDEGLANLMVALSQNLRKMVISKLGLGSCSLTPDATYNLVRCMRDYPTMQCLLLWRNNLGLRSDNEMSGIGVLLEELRINKNIRLVDLTATNLSEAALGKFATDLERTAREKRLAEVEHKSRAQRIVDMADEIERRKETAVWDDEKFAIKALENDLGTERAKFQEQLDLKDREKKNKTPWGQWRDKIMEITGRELIDTKQKIRIILKGNAAVTPSTVKRLGAFFDVREKPDYDEFIRRRRPFDNLYRPRRATDTPGVFLEYGEFKEVPELDLKEKNEEVRAAVEAWYDPWCFEDEYEKAERLRKAERQRELEELRRQGFDGAGGRYHQKDESEGADESGGDDGGASGLIDEDEVLRNQEANLVPGYGIGENAKRARKAGTGNVAIDMTGANANAATSAAKKALEDSVANLEFIFDLEATNSRTRVSRRNDEHVGRLRDQLDAAGLSAAPALDTMLSQISPESFTNTEDSTSTDALFAELYNLALSWQKLNELHASGGQPDDIQQAQAFVVAEKSRLANAFASLELDDAQREQGFTDPYAVPTNEGQALLVLGLIGEMLKQDEATPGNLELAQVLLQRVYLGWAEQLHVRGLTALAAAQGSVHFFHYFLYYSHEDYINLDHVLGLCTSHPTKRIQLTTLFVQRFAAMLGMQRGILQEFLEDIAAQGREQPDEERGAGRLELINLLLGVQDLALSVTAVGNDGMCIFTRACHEGDVELMHAVAEAGKVENFNGPVFADGGFTPLHLAVLSDSVETVQWLIRVADQLRESGDESRQVNLSAKCKCGDNALDIAILMEKKKGIVDALRNVGLASKSDEVAAAHAAQKAAEEEQAAKSKEEGKLGRGERGQLSKQQAAQRGFGGR